MFGDPDNNSKNWPLVSLKDCLVAIDSGKSITCENYPRTGDLPAILKLSAVTYGEYQPEENKQLPLAEQFIKEAEVHVGDLLFSRKNTLEYVGMTAFVKQTPPKLMMPDLIFRLVPQENVRPQYLHQLINHPMYRGTISGLANGSAGSMPNISKQKLNNLAIPLPPVELQMEIEPFIEQSDKSKFISFKSQFIEMFDGKGYSVVNASLFMTNMRNGLSPSKKGTYYEKVLTLSAITQGGFDPEAWKDGVFDDCPPEDKRIRAFEFYMCRGNGNRTLVGTAVYTEENYPDLVFPDTVIAAHIDTEKVLLPYLHIAWKMPAIREQIEENARTTNGTYKINQKVIAGIEIILPSIEKQKEFVTLVEQSDKSK